jgi:hypothetical protein
MLTISCGSENSKKTIFDVPALIDKNVDEIKTTLGKATSDSEPTKEQLEVEIDQWDKTFEKDGYELLVTYNPNTRKVIDFFVSNTDATKKNNYDDLLQITNLSDEPSSVSIEKVNPISNPEELNGIKVSKE